ncbi:MAG: hypothetical protein ABI190_10955 [Casimicrobiaceae bacterium]
MSRIRSAARAGALLPMFLAGSALAQATQQLEIDFAIVAPVPLSPLLTLAIASAVCAIAAFALWRTRRGWRGTSWLLALFAVVPVAGLLASLHPISSAQAIPPPVQIPLTTSPSTTPAFPGYYLAVNNTGSSVTLTSVQLTNLGPVTINPNTTCAPGLELAPGGSCAVFLSEL